MTNKLLILGVGALRAVPTARVTQTTATLVSENFDKAYASSARWFPACSVPDSVVATIFTVARENRRLVRRRGRIVGDGHGGDHHEAQLETTSERWLPVDSPRPSRAKASG